MYTGNLSWGLAGEWDQQPSFFESSSTSSIFPSFLPPQVLGANCRRLAAFLGWNIKSIAGSATTWPPDYLNYNDGHDKVARVVWDSAGLGD